MTDENKRPPTSEEMIRRARERTASSPSEGPASSGPSTHESASSTAESAPVAPEVHEDLATSLREEIARRESGQSVTPHPVERPASPRPAPRMSTPDYLPPGPSSRASLLRRIPIGWLVVGLVFAGGSLFRSITSADRDETGVVVGAGDVASDALEVGDCLLFPTDVADDGSFEFDSLTAVPCSEPHDMEVFGQVLHPDGLHPGNDALSDFAAEKCEPLFESYVGLRVEQEARLVYSVSYPQVQSWKAGDRGVDCLLESWDGTQLTGSQKDQGVLGFGGLVVGSCYDYTEEETYVYFTDVDCADAHTLQIYATETLPHGEFALYPGDDAIEAVAEPLCASGFGALSPTITEAEAEFFWVAPDATTWDYGDRLIQCHLFGVGGNLLVGSYTVEG